MMLHQKVLPARSPQQIQYSRTEEDYDIIFIILHSMLIDNLKVSKNLPYAKFRIKLKIKNVRSSAQIDDYLYSRVTKYALKKLMNAIAKDKKYFKAVASYLFD